MVGGFKSASVKLKSDLELVAFVKEGERWAFAELVNRHQKPLLRLVLRLLREPSIAEDVVQEAFLKSYQKLSTFEGRSSFKSWLYQIAINTAKNRFRDKSNLNSDIEQTHLGVDPGAETDLIKGDVREMIRRQIERLPERQRIALTLRIFDDLSFKEIADIMECPYDTAKANYRHALLKLKEKLESEENRAILAHFAPGEIQVGGERVWEAEQ
jgi:RNA polymerase sigma-70 factor (ECF subfamily)